MNTGTSFRSPSLLERFFYGVHQDSVNIGNPYLHPERGKDIDLGYRFRSKRIDFSAGLFRTVIENFIEIANTGETDPESGLEVWKWLNFTKVVLKGGELEFHYHFSKSLSYTGNISYVIARDVRKREYIYEIPPVILNNTLIFEKEFNGVKARVRFVAHTECRQDRVAEFEKETPGFTGYNLYSSATFKDFRLNLAVTNITDKSYHRHLSRVRYMNDGMGRSIQISLTKRF